MTRRARLVATAGLLALALGGCGGGDDREPAAASSGATTAATARSGSATPTRPRVRRALRLKLIGRFHRPLFVTQPPDDPRRLFVVEKGGRVRVIRDGRVLRRPFLSLRGRVSDLTEQGLVGLAFAPSYRRTRLVYVTFTDLRGTLRLEEWRTSRTDPDHAPKSSRRLVLKIPQPAPTHNGGNILFGPDGLLYLGAGDGGGPGDPHRNGQNRGVLLGKVLRIDPRRHGRRRYRVPTTNPFVRVKGARDEIYAYGLRNPWRFSFDRTTGDFVLGDVGQETFEELDYRPRGHVAGSNFGWSAFEGNRRFNRAVRRPRQAIRPMHTYGRDRGCSVIAGYVMRDPTIPKMDGRLVYSDFCSGEISSIVPHAPLGRDPRSEHVRVDLPSSFGEDRAGHVYVTSLGGAVYRLVQGQP